MLRRAPGALANRRGALGGSPERARNGERENAVYSSSPYWSRRKVYNLHHKEVPMPNYDLGILLTLY